MRHTRENRFQIDTKQPSLICPGASREEDGIRFTVSVPEGEEAALILYDKKNVKNCTEAAFPKTSRMGSLRTIKILGLAEKEYWYQYKIGEILLCDPYAKVVTGGLGGMDFSPYDWKEDTCLQLPYDTCIMYHLHVRNFTKHPKSGVRHKGTLLGLQEKLSYLKELGINQIKLMPVYPHEVVTALPRGKEMLSYQGDFSFAKEGKFESSLSNLPLLTQQVRHEGGKHDFWGYEEGAYFAINEAYCATADPVREMKDLVRSCHEKRIEVLLDFYFPSDIPARHILDCLTYWKSEYHIDGFHIIGREDVFSWLNGDAYLATSKILVSYIPDEMDCRNICFAQHNDGFLVEARKLLKGDEGVLEAFTWRSKSNPKDHAVINYITNHDGFTLKDLVSYDVRHNEENGEDNRDGSEYNFSWNCGVEGESRKKSITDLRAQQMRNAFLMLLFAQGTPMIMSGDEFCNSQKGNNNPYCLDNEISWVNWGTFPKNGQMTAFVKQAIAFRKDHPILCGREPLSMTDPLSYGYPDLSYHSQRAWYNGFAYHSRQIGMMYCEKYAGKEEFLYIGYNLNPLPQELAMPKLPAFYRWHKVVDTSRKEGFLPKEEVLPEDVKSMEYPARSIIVLLGKKGK